MKVRLQGARPEKIVNMALARGIFLWDVKKEKDFMTFRIRSSGYEALKAWRMKTLMIWKYLIEEGCLS